MHAALGSMCGASEVTPARTNLDLNNPHKGFMLWGTEGRQGAARLAARVHTIREQTGLRGESVMSDQQRVTAAEETRQRDDLPVETSALTSKGERNADHCS
jgi:hypothetical protein